MNGQNSILVATAIYKLACLGAGLLMTWMGFKLFLTRYEWESSETKFSWKGFGLSIQKTAPGIFFAIFGTVIICFTVWKGFETKLSPSDFEGKEAAAPTKLPQQLELPSFSEFAESLRTLNNNIPVDMKTQVYGNLFDQAAISPTPDQFPDMNSAKVGQNIATLTQAYCRFPDKQRKLSELINQLLKKYP
jgi:hypothetical protein